MAFDYRDFVQYRNNVDKMADSFQTWIITFILQEGERFIAEVKRRTPVDTGDLRSHWQLDGITHDGDSIHCWFINPMYYATFVEYGHAKPYRSGAAPGSADWVEGYFMMTVSLDIIERNLPKRFDREYRAWLLSLGAL